MKNIQVYIKRDSVYRIDDIDASLDVIAQQRPLLKNGKMCTESH